MKRDGTATYWGLDVPADWVFVKRWGDGYAFQRHGLRVLVDCETKADGHQWIHVSYSRAHWTPIHSDTVLVKETFIGNDRYAYAVLPPKDRYVNLHPNCLHLWARMDGQPVLPEFDVVIEGIGRTI
jgi:hypothetical protein